MSFFQKTLVLGALVSVAVGGNLLRAQPVGEEKSPAEVTAPLQKTAKLSPAEMQQQTGKYIDAMQGFLKRMVELQQLARKQKDVIKLNCVNDKLLQVKQLLNIAESSRTNMVEAIANRDEPARTHQFGQVTIAHEKAGVLRDEAEACIGEELVFLGPTEVQVDEPELPDDPTEDNAFDINDMLEPPGYASPFL